MEKSEGINYPIEFMRIAGVILITFTHTNHDFTAGPPHFILEELPRYGTLLLSVISGYLYYTYRGVPGLLNKKIKSLLVPFLIANIAVLLPVLIIYACGYNYLNRFTYDIHLVTDGLFALNDVPINPPTYFIRDLFIIFCFLALLQKDWRGLLFIIPLAAFGTVLLRTDIAILFLCGFLIKKYRLDTVALWQKIAVGLPIVLAGIYFFEFNQYKFLIALFIFLALINLKFTFARTGAFTYFLHLYHAPIIVFLVPLLRKFPLNPYADVALQIVLAIALCSLGFRIIKRLKLRFVVGNR